MDIYGDYFTREQLLLSIVNAQYVPGMLGAMGLFETVPMTSTTLDIEALPDDGVAESAAIPRGAPPKPLLLEKRVVEKFGTASYAWSSTVLADEVLNLRSDGTSGAAAVISDRRDKKIAQLRKQAEWQLEFLRVSVLNAPTNAFGTAPAAAAIAFGASDTVAVNAGIHTSIVLALEAALGGINYAGLDAFCSNDVWVALIQSKTMRETYLNTAAASSLRGAGTDQFSYGGITWHRYRAGGNIAVTAGQCKIVPRGVTGLFVQGFAPNDTVDSVGVGSVGAPYYLFSRPIETDAGVKGYAMTLQMHPVLVCTRPTAVITVDLS